MQVFSFQYLRWDSVSWSVSVEHPQRKAALHTLLWYFSTIGTLVFPSEVDNQLVMIVFQGL